MTTRYCSCCGNERPINQFNLDTHSPGLRESICMFCAILPAVDAVRTARDTAAREFNVLRHQRDASKQARVAAYMERYQREGKQCTSCRAYKAPTEYNACAPRGDGLQPNCRACDKLRVTLMAQVGGLKLWRTVRATMRAQAAERAAEK